MADNSLVDVPFHPKFRFVFSHERRDRVQVHIQSQYARKKKWKKEQKLSKEGKAASESFRDSFVAITELLERSDSTSNSNYAMEKVADDSMTALRQVVKPQSLLGAGRANPFSTYPISDPKLDIFVDQCKCRYRREEMGLLTICSSVPRLPPVWSSEKCLQVVSGPRLYVPPC